MIKISRPACLRPKLQNLKTETKTKLFDANH